MRADNIASGSAIPAPPDDFRVEQAPAHDAPPVVTADVLGLMAALSALAELFQA